MNKKFWLLLLSCFVSALILSACSSEEGNNTGNSEDNEIQVDEKKVKASLEDFQKEVSSLINEYDDDFEEFAQTVEEKTENVSNEELQALKNEASQSSQKLAEELRNMNIPAELESYSEDLNQSLDNLADRFDARSDDLDNEDTNAALVKAKTASENILTEFKGALGSIYESLGLEKPEFINETE
ncbi:hypothetical protein [Bacillus sp. Marseille-Q3570]|uniref:hypothetical protein n=1 Tax=Bacillus sp. Marseille-Q3570 TaxID=2963522 RepID=UPI0021B72288|nr:hypothetical protein [Bacillus sp. Marseille-Q3570]